MIGKPKFKQGEKVKFTFELDSQKQQLEGKIAIIDKNGTFFDDSDVSYDIESHNGMFFKHIPESCITRA